jgi:hypothetical protein
LISGDASIRGDPLAALVQEQKEGRPPFLFDLHHDHRTASATYPSYERLDAVGE